MSVNQWTRQAVESGEGLLRLAPCWVPRSFVLPGRRLRLAPSDYYALGANRGGIDERWFASTTEATNENRAPDEGLSYVEFQGRKTLLKEAIETAGDLFLGADVMEREGGWSISNPSIRDVDVRIPAPGGGRGSHERQTEVNATLANGLPVRDGAFLLQPFVQAFSGLGRIEILGVGEEPAGEPRQPIRHRVGAEIHVGEGKGRPRTVVPGEVADQHVGAVAGQDELGQGAGKARAGLDQRDQ